MIQTICSFGFFLLLTTSSIFGSIDSLQAPSVASSQETQSKAKTAQFFRVSQHECNQQTATLIPKIHQNIWPNFCIHHLVSDPLGCSAWGENRSQPLDLELYLYGYSHAYIDSDLIARLGDLIYLIPTHHDSENRKNRCRYGKCSECHQSLLYAINCTEYDECDEYNYEPADTYYVDFSTYYAYHLTKRCDCDSEGNCKGCKWVHYDGMRKTWDCCLSPTIYFGYFDWNAKKYFDNLKNYLLFLEDNPSCNCYWPQINKNSQLISNHIYEKLESLLQPFYSENFYKQFSLHYVPQATTFDQSLTSFVWVHSSVWKDGGTRTLHEIISSLLTHAFFYTNYREVLFDLDCFARRELPESYYSLFHNTLIDIEEEIQNPFLSLYSQCIKNHPHPKVHYERGMVLFHQGDYLDSLEDIRRFISYAEEKQLEALLTSDLYLQEGRLLNESLSYDESIVALTKAIAKDSKNTEAHFERAIAYFETGNFEKALSDYLASGIAPNNAGPKKFNNLEYLNFSQGVIYGMVQGAHDSVEEFIPSLLGSLRGLSRGLWAFASDPIAISQEMVESVYACMEFIKDNSVKEVIGKLVPEIQECLEKWDQLDDRTKGRYTGYILAKYGTDIFICSGSIKAFQLYRNLRRANAIMTLETASVSPKLAQEVMTQASKEEMLRKSLLSKSNLKLQWDKQSKHIPGKKNYILGKSILEHPNPQKLVNEFAGSGLKKSKHIPGIPGYTEIVNFNEHIGYHINRETREKIATTWGKIHYAKDGVHIVPTMPRK